MATVDSSWWFRLVRKEIRPATFAEDENGEKVLVKKAATGLVLDYDHKANRIEKERGNAQRMGVYLVVEASPQSDYYTIYTTPSLDGAEVVLYNEQHTNGIRVARSSLFYNGDYLWTHRVCPLV